MAATAVGRAWMTVKPHIPLVKFRKGGLGANDPRLSAAHGGSELQGLKPAPTGSSRQATQAPVLEDYQLPLKYRRRPIDEFEIEYINRGGPE